MHSACFGLIWAAASLGVVGCAAAPSNEGTDSAPIIGGVVEPEDSAIARRTVLFTLASGDGTHGCTATILDDAHALTAAHCLIGTEDQHDIVLVFATHFSHAAVMRPVTALRPYVANQYDDDVAVITFGGGLPAGYAPVNLPDDVKLVNGMNVVQAGYGKASADGNGSDRGILRSVTTQLTQVESSTHRLFLSSEGHTTCSGDSGGPDFVTSGGTLVQVGVHSTGSCGAGSSSMDVRAYTAWIRAQL